jgi:hypothetical protein
MLAVQIKINGKRLTVAGAEDLSVLSAIVSATGRLGRKTADFQKSRRKPDIWLSSGGLTARSGGVPDEHLHWIRHRLLKVGDRVSIRVVDVARADRPSSSSPSRNKTPTADGRAFFKAVKAQYMKLRRQYEGRGLTKRSTRTRRQASRR